MFADFTWASIWLRSKCAAVHVASVTFAGPVTSSTASIASMIENWPKVMTSTSIPRPNSASESRASAILEKRFREVCTGRAWLLAWFILEVMSWSFVGWLMWRFSSVMAGLSLGRRSAPPESRWWARGIRAGSPPGGSRQRSCPAWTPRRAASRDRPPIPQGRRGSRSGRRRSWHRRCLARARERRRWGRRSRWRAWRRWWWRWSWVGLSLGRRFVATP